MSGTERRSDYGLAEFQFVGDGDDPYDFAVNAVILGTALIVFTTLINALGVKLMSRINSTGVFIELVAAVAIIVLLAINIHNPPTVLFDTQGRGSGMPLGYFGAFLIASLASAYVMYGFDTASSLGEETVDPRRTASAAILRAITASFVLGGLILLFGILAAPDLTDPLIGDVAGGLQYIVLLVLGGTLGKIILISIAIAITVCVLAVHTAAIRMMFAMARDNALPAASALARVDPKHKTPIVPAILIGAIAIGTLVVNIRTPEIFTAVTSVAIIMIYLAYLLVTAPMLAARLRGEWPVRDPEGRRYFSLGRPGLPVNILAVLWGSLMALNLAWPRAEVYGERWYLRWVAFISIGFVALSGLVWFRLRGRHKLGTLPQHMADNLEEAP
ncbi:APC family permease [Pseudonocardia sp. H11422]|uniref:APC family permease n=1 Tax=Pseudonocardia sp. H11422 TaxID=2835866 RepID=UPI001BDC9E5A|nr:amino acid permease [Pseudonocardia sp. H11422]